MNDTGGATGAGALATCGRSPPTPTPEASAHAPTPISLGGWPAPSPPVPGRLRQVERTGREIGRALAPADSDGSARAFEQILSALGFQPELDLDQVDPVCCRLGNCPYSEAVRENQAVVCTLHEGITAGLLERLVPRASLTRFEPHDPDEAGCLIEVTGAGWTKPPS